MLRTGLDDLAAFEIVARECSFTRAAAVLGVSQSALSRSMRGLEERLGVRLLSRTTRSVSTTEAGARLLAGLRPALAMIDEELATLRGLRVKPSGTVRVTAVRHAFETILRPVLPTFLADHPEIVVEVSIDDSFVDIVSGRFDAGLRLGGTVEKDMIAIRLGRDVETAVVASPAYIAIHGTPETPQQLLNHRCINYRTAASGVLYPWPFEKAEQVQAVKVAGSVTLNDGEAMLAAAVDGLGLAFTFLDRVQEELAAGRLVRVLADWAVSFPGYQLYHPSRRQVPRPLAALIECLRSRAGMVGGSASGKP